MLHQNFVYYGSKHEIEWTKIKFGTNFSDKKCTIPFFFFLNKKKMVTLIAFYICVRMVVMSIIKRKEKENGSNVFLILKYKMTSLSLSLSLTNYLLCFV